MTDQESKVPKRKGTWNYIKDCCLSFPDKFYDFILKYWIARNFLLVLMILLPIVIGVFFTLDMGLAESIRFYFSSIFPSVSFAHEFYPGFIYLAICIIILLTLSFLSDRIKSRRVDLVREKIKKDTSDYVSTVLSHLDSSVNKIDSAIHNAPNRKIFQNSYSKLFSIYVLVQEFRNKLSGTEIDPKAYKKTLDVLLDKVCELTKEFSGKTTAEYTANLMVYIHNNENNKDLISTYLSDKDNWIYHHDVRIEFVRFVLSSIAPVDESEREAYTPVHLGVVKKDDVFDEIPGAPDSVNKRATIFNSTRFTDKKDLEKFSTEVQKKAKKYFEERGKKIKSIISFRILKQGLEFEQYSLNREEQDGQNNNKPFPILGVLNIDCTEEYPLGDDHDFLYTFSTLIEPVLGLIGPIFEGFLSVNPELKNIDNFKINS